MKTRVQIFIGLLFLVAATACEKTEGSGGNATIYGQVWVLDYNQEFTIKFGEYWAQEEDVYIMYGNDTIPSDDVKTGYNGTYWFKYLQEGTYTIYAMSEDTTFIYPSGKFPVKTTVSITDIDQTVKAQTLTIVR